MEPTFNGSKASLNSDDNDVMNVNQEVDHQAASVACVIEEEVLDEAMSVVVCRAETAIHRVPGRRIGERPPDLESPRFGG